MRQHISCSWTELDQEIFTFCLANGGLLTRDENERTEEGKLELIRLQEALMSGRMVWKEELEDVGRMSRLQRKLERPGVDCNTHKLTE